MLGRILEIDHTLVYQWIRAFGETLLEPAVVGEISQMEFDECGILLVQKKKTLGH
jgi:hypothetical protein